MEETDEVLIDKYLAGDEMSFRKIIDRYTNRIYNFTVRFVGKLFADDIVQDIFVKVWKNIRKFDKSKSSFKTWIFNIARNTVIDFLRKKKMTNFSSLDTEDVIFEETLEDDNLLQNEILEQVEYVEFLNKCIDELPDNYKEVLVLYYQEDMTFLEIGNLLGKPLNTVKSYHYRALLSLKDKFHLHQN